MTNPVLFEVKNSWLVQVQYCKGTPLEYLLRDLKTNEKPSFWALDQWEPFILASISVLAKFEVLKSNANVSINWQSRVKRVIREH